MRRGRKRLCCLALGSVLAAVLLVAAAATGTALVPGSAHVAGVVSATAVSTAEDHACARFSDGTVRCWGKNDQGQLGDGTRTSRLTPVAVRGLSGVIEVSAGFGFTCAVVDAGGGSGPVKCWGAPSKWLGVGPSHGTLVPVTIGGITDAIAVSSGIGIACALLSDRTVECWGDNSRGELGNGTRASSSTPVRVPGLSGVQAISAGDTTVCVVMQSTGAVSCWGSAGYVAPDVPLDTLTPTAVPGLSGAVSVSASPYNACALLKAGTVDCWAMSSHPFTAAPVPGLSGVKVFAFSIDGQQTEHTCVLFAGGSVKCRSPDPYVGQDGNGSTSSNGDKLVAVRGLRDATTISAADFYTCAVRSAGGVECWGSNEYGQLGNGTTTNSSTPVAVGSSGVTCAMTTAVVSCRSATSSLSVSATLTPNGRVATCSQPLQASPGCVPQPGAAYRTLFASNPEPRVGPFACIPIGRLLFAPQPLGAVCTVLSSGKGFRITPGSVSRVSQISPGSHPPCTRAALTAALERAYRRRSLTPSYLARGWQCAGSFARADFIDVHGRISDDITVVFRAARRTWSLIGRANVCEDGEIPARIWYFACAVN
jgi:Regulator of chromosome condensation (RCC1) repeat